MRLLQIMTSRALGGAETYSTDTILSLHEAGAEQHIVMDRKAPRFHELEHAGLFMHPTVLDLPFRLMQKHRMRLLLHQIRPDIVQTWMRRAASIVPTGDRQIIGWFGGYYDPKHFTNCNHIVGVTRDIAAHMTRNGVAADRAHYIPTFPVIEDMPAIDRSKFDTPQNAKILLTLSRLHQKKGLDTFLHALKQLPDDCFAWIAGDGPLANQLKTLAQSLGLMHRVRFLGWRMDRAALLRSCDICVLPSRYEPFGNVILEAWAARTPFVACASAGPAAHVTDSVTGLLTPIDDVNALTTALRKVLADEDLRNRMVENGYAEYHRSYTRNAVTKQWLTFYNTISRQQMVTATAS